MTKNNTKKPDHYKQVLAFISQYPIFRTENGVYIVIEIAGIKHAVLIKSGIFRRTFRSQYEDFYDTRLIAEHLDAAIERVESVADATDVVKAGYRTIERDGELYYDFGDGYLAHIKKDGSGYEIIKNDGSYKFLTSPDQLKQVHPKKGSGNALEQMRTLFNVSAQLWILLLVYIISCFNSSLQHFILYLTGREGTGKTEASRMLKAVIDPAANTVESLGSPLDLIIKLTNSYYVCVDNVRYLSKEMSDLLCKIVTGMTKSLRELYTTAGLASLKVKNPILFNGINDFIKEPDLMSRALVMQTQAEFDEIMNIDELWKKFHNILPEFLHEIFIILSKALAIAPTIKKKDLHRLTNTHIFFIAIAKAMDFDEAEFDKIFSGNNERQMELIYGNNVLVHLLRGFMQNKKVWTGRTSILHQNLRSLFESGSFRDEYGRDAFPVDTARMVKKFNELAKVMRYYEISFSVKKDSDSYSFITVNNHADVEVEPEEDETPEEEDAQKAIAEAIEKRRAEKAAKGKKAVKSASSIKRTPIVEMFGKIVTIHDTNKFINDMAAIGISLEELEQRANASGL